MDKATKTKQNKIVIIIALLVLVVVLLGIFLFWQNKNRTNESSSPSGSSTNTTTSTSSDDNMTKDEQIEKALDETEAAIAENPKEADNYSQKASLLYMQGDKQGALDVINQGLDVDPNDELLKSKKDTIEREFYNDASSEGARQ